VAARRIDTRRMLDLDYLGAEITEEHPRQRCGEECRGLDDPDPG
jgi:hypothetical protein